MKIGGFQKISLSDFPGAISSIIFTRGCGFRCPYCHNPELVDPRESGPEISFERIRSFLHSRSGRIEGVVVTGGEPTAQPDLPQLICELRSLGLRVKLDTNGSRPSMIRGLLEKRLVDYVAMDLKAPPERYPEVVRAEADVDAVMASVKLILQSDCAHEFRTTYAPPLVSAADLSSIAQLVKGCRCFVIQAFRPGKTLDPRFPFRRPDREEMMEIKARLEAAGHNVTVR